MKMKLSTMGDASARTFSALLAGQPGLGKTRCLETCAPMLAKLPDGAPDWSRVLFIDCENGSLSVKHLAAVQKVVPYAPYTPSEILKELRAGELTGKFDLVFVDGLDSLMTSVFSKIEAADAASAKPDPRGVWQTYGKVMKSWIEGMRDLPGVSTVFVTHPKEDETADIRIAPRTAGGNMLTADTLQGMFDYVFFMLLAKLTPTSEPVRAFLTSRTGTTAVQAARYMVKARVPGGVAPLPALVPADLGAVWTHIFGAK